MIFCNEITTKFEGILNCRIFKQPIFYTVAKVQKNESHNKYFNY
jgi:hypothetical protein